MSRHGAMGPSGFGTTHGMHGGPAGDHGASSYTGGDQGGAHGVSKNWVRSKVGSANASQRRLGDFAGRVNAQQKPGKTNPKRDEAYGAALKRRKVKSTFHKAESSGWDRWRAKKGK